MIDSIYQKKLNDLLAVCRKNLRTVDEDLITRAFLLSLEAHKNNLRASGEPYFIHPFEVAMIVAKEIALDDVSIVSALLHDVIEDTDFELKDVRAEFGDAVADIVDGITKITDIFESHEVTQAASEAVLLALQRFASGSFVPQAQAEMAARGCARPMMQQTDRHIDWTSDDTASVLRKMGAADGFPGVADALFGQPCQLFDAWPEATLRGAPGEIIARRETALLRATVDGAVWIGHVKRADSIKLPTTLAFESESQAIAEAPLQGYWRVKTPTWQDITYEESGAVGTLHFEFYNGAMSTRQCERLRAALVWAKQRPTTVLLLMGGADFWSNGIHLNVIEAASLSGGSAADESWRNINAMNDLTLEVIDTGQQLTVAALGGNAGAGGCFLARACDLVWAREAVLLNPHYKNMGNLYGSEYWTYSLPRRVGLDAAQAIMRKREPLTARHALIIGFSDACLSGDAPTFRADVALRAAELAAAPERPARLAAKRETRARDEALKPLAAYRAEEMMQMRRNFYGFDPSYHVARHHFVRKSPASWTPRHLALHRDLNWKAQA